MELDTLIDDFLTEEQLKNRREQGFKSMKRNLKKFTDYLKTNDVDLKGFNYKEAMNYQKYLLETGRKDGKPFSNVTILAYLNSATCFCNYLKKKSLIHSNPFKEIKSVRKEKKLPKNILREKEMDGFLYFVSKFNDAKGLANQITRYKLHLIFELMYSTGLRISEVASLKVDDIDLIRSVVMVREGKGGKERVAFLNEYAREILGIYINKFRSLVFNEYNEKHGDSLFGMTLSTMTHKVNVKLKELIKEKGITDFSSHGFRHAVGYHLLRAGCNIRHIQQILGHQQLRSTEVYTKVDKEDLKKVIDTFHPRKWRERKL